MAIDLIHLEEVISTGEYAKIDRFCDNHPDLESLAAFLRDEFNFDLVLDQDLIEGYVADSSNLTGRAEALARPASERECAIILSSCFKSGTPCTISAGKSNLTGSATPEGGVLLSMVRMLAPEPKIDADAMSVSCPVGMILEDLRNIVLEKTFGRMMFPVDPTSRADAAIGGAIACNASGFTPGQAGSMRGWVESIDFLLPNGLKISASRGQYISRNGRFVLSHKDQKQEFPVPCHRYPAIKNASGPFSSPDGCLDFVDLVVGSEGIFGLVTRCTLSLKPCPKSYLDLFFSLPKEKDAIDFLEVLQGRFAGDLSGFSAVEYFGSNCRRYMDHEARLFRGGNQVAVYLQIPIEKQSPQDAALQWLELLTGSVLRIEADSIILIQSERDRALLIDARHSLPANSLEVVKRYGTYTIMTDALVPPDNFRDFLSYTHNLINSEGIEYVSFGHLGDCHLHFTLLPDKSQLERATKIYDAIIAKSAELGGVYSGEHGTGKRKRADFLACYGPEAVHELRKSKAAVDPHFLLNRGNVITYKGES